MAKVSRILRLKRLFTALIFLTTLQLPLFLGSSVKAANLENRSVELGSVTASEVTNHNFQFDLITGGSLGSMAFQYCESPLLDEPCVAPSGIDASGAVLANETGETGFSIHPNTVSNRIVITRPPALSTPGTVSYDFTNILNPDTANHTTYIRITVYSNIDATGVYVDYGVAAFSLTPALGVNVFVPPYLTFCVGKTVGLKCQSASGLNIDLGELNVANTSSATTQFAGATNDNTGYNVSVIGTTMTSGNNEITRLSSPTGSVAGTAQFGINLRNNSTPDIGKNKEGSGTLSPKSGYGSSNLFKFNPGETISSTGNASEFNRMTVSYVINIKPDQPPGIYSTTLTYVAVASF